MSIMIALRKDTTGHAMLCEHAIDVSRAVEWHQRLQQLSLVALDDGLALLTAASQGGHRLVPLAEALTLHHTATPSTHAQWLQCTALAKSAS